MGKVNEYLAARDCDVQTSVSSSVDTSYQAVDDKNEELSAIRDDLAQITSNAQQAADRAAAQLAAQQAKTPVELEEEERRRREKMVAYRMKIWSTIEGKEEGEGGQSRGEEGQEGPRDVPALGCHTNWSGFR